MQTPSHPPPPSPQVFLPALPVHWAPGLTESFPLSLFVPFIAGLWDEQKRALDGDNVFVGCPSTESMLRLVGARPNDPALWAEDGVHPSMLGYRAWGTFIGDAIFSHLGTTWR